MTQFLVQKAAHIIFAAEILLVRNADNTKRNPFLRHVNFGVAQFG